MEWKGSFGLLVHAWLSLIPWTSSLNHDRFFSVFCCDPTLWHTVTWLTIFTSLLKWYPNSYRYFSISLLKFDVKPFTWIYDDDEIIGLKWKLFLHSSLLKHSFQLFYPNFVLQHPKLYFVRQRFLSPSISNLIRCRGLLSMCFCLWAAGSGSGSSLCNHIANDIDKNQTSLIYDKNYNVNPI